MNVHASPGSSFRLDFVAVGPQRTGSTWLYEYLRNHPVICLPRGVKETLFFDYRYDKGFDWYAKHFPYAKSDKLRGEIGPSYFHSDAARLRLAQSSPDCRIIITLREPRARLLSLYRHHVSRANIPVDMPVARALEQYPGLLVEPSRYAAYTERWRSRFGKEHVLVLFMQELEQNPQSYSRRICNFLGIPYREPTSALLSDRVNPGREPRFARTATASHRVATYLRSKRMFAPINAFKALGLDRLLFVTPDVHTCTPELPVWFEDLLETERKALMHMLEVDLAEWA
jgi:hypothetical protein